MKDQPAPPNSQWVSAHLRFSGSLFGADGDWLITDLIAPFVTSCQARGWIQRFFFVRYGEGGPHLRLRLGGNQYLLATVVKAALEQHIAETICAVTWASHESTARSLSLEWAVYTPEVWRYGGPDGVRVAEQFFHASSEASLALLKGATPGDRAARLGKAVLSMVVLLHTFCVARRGAAALCDRYAINHLGTVSDEPDRRPLSADAFGTGHARQAMTLALHLEEVWKRLEAGAALPDSLERYARSLREVQRLWSDLLARDRLVRGDLVLKGWNEAVEALVPSYMHMMNNRLGVSPREESYLAHVTARSLERNDTTTLTPAPR